ncbi:acyl carrier protein [Nocardia takedensis]
MTAPNASDIAAVVRKKLADNLECPVEHVDLSLPLTELPGVESIRLINTVVACERHWKVVLDNDDLAPVRTGDDLCAVFAGRLQARAG